MTDPLLRVMACPPTNAGWQDGQKTVLWQELGYFHSPNLQLAQTQHEALCRSLSKSGAEVLCLSADNTLSLDAVYCHDASFATDFGVILMNPGKRSRVAEAGIHEKFYREREITVLGRVSPPATSEGGDMVWLNPRTLLVGHGYRTNAAGIEQICSLLAPHGVTVLKAPLPHGPGPSACLHLMSLMSMLDHQTILVDLPWLAVETVQLLKSRELRLIEIDDSERATLACNVLSLGNNRLLAIQENGKTNQRLREAGFDVWTFPGSEICLNGSGGPTCLTRPLLRA